MNKNYIAISQYEIKTNINDCIYDSSEVTDYTIVNKNDITRVFIDWKFENDEKIYFLRIKLKDGTEYHVYSKTNTDYELLKMLSKTLNLLNSNKQTESDINDEEKLIALEFLKTHQMQNEFSQSKSQQEKESEFINICQQIVDAYSADDNKNKTKYTYLLASWLVNEPWCLNSLKTFMIENPIEDNWIDLNQLQKQINELEK